MNFLDEVGKPTGSANSHTDMAGHGDIIHFMAGAPNTANFNINDPKAYRSFNCPFCETPVHGTVIARTSAHPDVQWMRCTNCGAGIVANENEISPASREGQPIEGLPEDVQQAYEEARRNAAIGSYTSCELICRKILMHVAVDKGADPGKSFAAYLSHLESAGFVTPPMKAWVDQIRKNGNIATHELPATDRNRAIGTLVFTAQLLRLIYEMTFKYRQFSDLSEPEDG